MIIEGVHEMTGDGKGTGLAESRCGRALPIHAIEKGMWIGLAVVGLLMLPWHSVAAQNAIKLPAPGSSPKAAQSGSERPARGIKAEPAASFKRADFGREQGRATRVASLIGSSTQQTTTGCRSS